MLFHRPQKSPWQGLDWNRSLSDAERRSLHDQNFGTGALVAFLKEPLS